MDQPEKKSKLGQQPGNKLSIIMFALLFMAIICIGGFVYMKGQNIGPADFSVKDFMKSIFQSNDQNNNPEIISEFKYEAKEHPVFKVYNDYIIQCTKNSITWLNKKGEKQQAKEITVDNPIMKTSGAYLLLADIKGNDFYVFNGKNRIWNEKTDGSLINADINNNGYVSIVKKKKGYKGAIGVYDPIGNFIFSIVRGGEYILTSKVLTSPESVIINTIDTSGIHANSKLELIDMHAKVVATATQEDAIFPSLWNLNSNYIMAVSDNMLVCYDMGLKEKWKKEFEKIYSSNIALGKYIIIAADRESKTGILSKGTTDVKIMNIKGQEAASYSLEGKVSNIESFNNILAISSGNEVHFINTSGNLIRKYSGRADIMGVQFFNKQEAIVVTKNDIVVLKIN